MKKVILSASLAICSITTFAQLDASFEKDTLTWERQPAVDITSDIKIAVTGLNPSGGVANTLTFSVGSGAPAGLYRFPGVTLTPGTGTSQLSFPFTVLRGTNVDNNALYIPIALSYHNGSAAVTKQMVLKVANVKIAKPIEEGDDGFYRKLTFLNAYNFDFYGKLNSNYVGVFNLYEPARERGKRSSAFKLLGITLGKADATKWRWGLNSGVMKINYGLGDNSPSETHRYENALVKALDSIQPGNKYLREFNKYTVTISNSAWSFYCQPLLQLNPQTMSRTGSRIYLHGHFELLVNRLTTKTVISTVEQDTALIPDPVPKNFALRVRTGDETSRTNTYYSGYFGGGLTFDIKLTQSAASSLFLQFTLGGTTNQPSFASAANYRGRTTNQAWNGFYLVRAAFNQKLSDATNLVISQDIRGLLPQYSPLYATFVGLNIKLDELLKLIKG